MSGSPIVMFILVMWVLMLAGGGIAVTVLGSFSVAGLGGEALDGVISSAAKAIIAVVMVVLWVFILSKIKNWMFQRQMRP